jgi:hypothetical protein
MKESEIESSKNYLKLVFDKEKDESVKNFILTLGSQFDKLDLEDSTNFKIKLDDLVYKFKKSNNLITVYSYSDNKSFEKKVDDISITKKDKISIAKKEQQFVPSQEKNISITIGSYSELVDAMKCILWSLDNNPSTIKKIFQHIYIKKDDEEIIIPESDYDITNKIISKAFRDNHFYVQKLQNNATTVWLYNNASNKRLGYFIDGKLRSVEWLSKFYDIPRTTIQSRLKKMNIDQAVKK